MKQPGIDLILSNGKIWTEDPVRPEAEAIAISGQRIVCTGSSAEILALKDGGTKVIDLQKRRVVPGFNDAHVHFYYGGASLASVQLRSAKSQLEVRDRIASFAQLRPKGEW